MSSYLFKQNLAIPVSYLCTECSSDPFEGSQMLWQASTHERILFIVTVSVRVEQCVEWKWLFPSHAESKLPDGRREILTSRHISSPINRAR